MRRRLPYLVGALSAGVLYLSVLVAVSLASEEQVLGAEQPKRFCGLYLDCHRMVAVVTVERVEALGSQRPDGVYYVVTLRFTSDAKRATMHTGRQSARVRTADGRTYARALDAERALPPGPAAPGLADVPVTPTTPHLARIVFDIPVNAPSPRLLVRDADWLSRLTELLLIGDEDSMFHAPTTFAMGELRGSGE